MSVAEFEGLAWLVFEGEAARALGFSREYMRKLVECGVLQLVQPKGAGQGKLRKVQLAQVVRIDLSAEARRFWEQEPLLMTPKAVMGWTGYNRATLEKIARAGGLTRIRFPGGEHAARYRKLEVAELMGVKG